MIYQVKHSTYYDYAIPVKQCYNLAFITPRKTPNQHCLQSRVTIRPYPIYNQKRTDYFGNTLHYFSLQESHQKLEVTATSRVNVKDRHLNLRLDLGNSCQHAASLLRTDPSQETLLALEYLFDSPMVRCSEELREFAADIFEDDKPLLVAASQLSERIYREFKYDPDFSDIATPLQDVMKHRRGVCQDFAHLAIGCLRAQGFPARYVSGYLETLPPPGQTKLEGADATHAWFAVYSPGEGWVEYDPTNNLLAAQQHIITAWGRDYSDVTPMRGVIFGGGKKQSLKVKVDVKRLEE